MAEARLIHFEKIPAVEMVKLRFNFICFAGQAGEHLPDEKPAHPSEHAPRGTGFFLHAVFVFRFRH
jgi:hypothetical protein